MTERWCAAPGFDLYEVSDQGRVRNVRTGRVLRAHPERKGSSMLVSLCRDGKQKTFTVHGLVLRTFVGPPPPGMECCHADGDVTNNRMSNLRWDTHAANEDDKRKHGTNHNASKTHCKHGHELSGDNLAIYSQGKRRCRACDRARVARNRAALTRPR